MSLLLRMNGVTNEAISVNALIMLPQAVEDIPIINFAHLYIENFQLAHEKLTESRSMMQQV